MHQIFTHPIIKERFGKTPDGARVDLYTLTNEQGVKIRITNYGGIIVSIICPDRYGQPADIVLGFDSLDEYLGQQLYFGCIVGRYANRIADGNFILNGDVYALNRNEGNNHLHGGISGFDKKIWQTREIHLREGSGYDHNWVLNNPDGSLNPAARVIEPTTGRILEAFTTEPGLQLYTGNYLDGSSIGKGGVAYNQYAGFALEAQHFPDSPNRPEFPTTVLNPGDTYSQTTVYKFTTDSSG